MIQFWGPRFPRPHILLLLFSCLLASALTSQRFFHALFLAWLQVKGVTLYFLDDVLLLYLPLEATQGVFERLALLQSYFCQRTTPPNLSWLDPLVIAR